MSELLVDIHVPKRNTVSPDGSHIDAGLAKWGRAELALALEDQGAAVTFSRGPDAYDLNAGEVHVLLPEYMSQRGTAYEVQVKPAIIALDSIAAVRNVSRAIGYDVPELNHPSVRTAARDKVETNRILARTDSLAKAFAPWRTSESLEVALDTIPADAVVVKPRNGMRGQHVQLGSKGAIGALHADGAFSATEDWVIEERLGMDVPMHVAGADEEQHTKIVVANAENMPKELRAYTFGRKNGELATHYVLRVAKPGTEHLHDDDWVYLDQDSVPDEVRGLTDKVARGFERHTGVDELHLGIDWVRAVRRGSTEPVWLPMEVNAGEPQLVYAHQHAGTARVHRTLLAEQLLRVAQNRSTVYDKESI